MSIRSYLTERPQPTRRWVTIGILIGSAATTYIDKRAIEQRFKSIEADIRALRIVNRVELGKDADELFARVRSQQRVAIDIEDIFAENILVAFLKKGAR